MLRLGVEPFQDGLGVFGNVGSLIVLPHEVLDAVKTLEPHDRGELNFLVLHLVRPHQVCADKSRAVRGAHHYGECRPSMSTVIRGRSPRMAPNLAPTRPEGRRLCRRHHLRASPHWWRSECFCFLPSTETSDWFQVSSPRCDYWDRATSCDLEICAIEIDRFCSLRTCEHLDEHDYPQYNDRRDNHDQSAWCGSKQDKEESDDHTYYLNSAFPFD